MKRFIAAVAVAASGLGIQIQPAAAQSYPIDCAILLCLAGGWPTSVPCARARAEFIRRITPWPIEPPLQIWRCPMNTAIRVLPGEEKLPRFWDAGFASGSASRQSLSGTGWQPANPHAVSGPAVLQLGPDRAALRNCFLQLARAVGSGADIDISGREFDFVRSIDVWHVRYSATVTGSAKNCFIRDQTDHGSYGVQGDFRWTGSAARLSPAWIRPRYDCNNPGTMRAVGVSWTDSFGVTGHEVVTY